MTAYVAKAKVSLGWFLIFSSYLLISIVSIPLSLNFLWSLFGRLLIRTNMYGKSFTCTSHPHDDSIWVACACTSTCIAFVNFFIYRSSNFHYRFRIRRREAEIERMLKIISYLHHTHSVCVFFVLYLVYLFQTFECTHLMLKSDTITTLTVRASELFSHNAWVYVFCAVLWLTFFLPFVTLLSKV